MKTHFDHSQFFWLTNSIHKIKSKLISNIFIPGTNQSFYCNKSRTTLSIMKMWMTKLGFIFVMNWIGPSKNCEGPKWVFTLNIKVISCDRIIWLFNICIWFKNKKVLNCVYYKKKNNVLNYRLDQNYVSIFITKYNIRDL